MISRSPPMNDEETRKQVLCSYIGPTPPPLLHRNYSNRPTETTKEGDINRYKSFEKSLAALSLLFDFIVVSSTILDFQKKTNKRFFRDTYFNKK